eukprot:407392_1
MTQSVKECSKCRIELGSDNLVTVKSAIGEYGVVGQTMPNNNCPGGGTHTIDRIAAQSQPNEDLVDSIEIKYKSDDDQEVPTAPVSADTAPKQRTETSNQSEDPKPHRDTPAHVIKKKFNQIFDASTAHYQSESKESKLPEPFTIFKNMFSRYVFCIWDCVTDIGVIMSLSQRCKKATFQESNTLDAYHTFLALAYISTIIG